LFYPWRAVLLGKRRDESAADPSPDPAQSSGFASALTRNRYCVVNIVIRNGAVAAVSYVGNTGGLVSQGSECAYTVQSCVN